MKHALTLTALVAAGLAACGGNQSTVPANPCVWVHFAGAQCPNAPAPEWMGVPEPPLGKGPGIAAWGTAHMSPELVNHKNIVDSKADLNARGKLVERLNGMVEQGRKIHASQGCKDGNKGGGSNVRDTEPGGGSGGAEIAGTTTDCEVAEAFELLTKADAKGPLPGVQQGGMWENGDADLYILLYITEESYRVALEMRGVAKKMSGFLACEIMRPGQCEDKR